ncbi:hypothetical protein CT19431_40077 [Cupriavidus taiwanensis]|nr:hypothetical protein CT19431_40077 [Cupriavidus taiwanensis]
MQGHLGVRAMSCAVGPAAFRHPARLVGCLGLGLAPYASGRAPRQGEMYPAMARRGPHPHSNTQPRPQRNIAQTVLRKPTADSPLVPGQARS